MIPLENNMFWKFVLKKTTGLSINCMMSEGINIYKSQCQFYYSKNCEIKPKLYRCIRIISILLYMPRKTIKIRFNIEHCEYSLNIFLKYLK